MNLVGQLGGDHQQAAQQLQGMGQVDTQQHAGMLSGLGVDPQQLENGGYQQHFDAQQQKGFAGDQSGGGNYADQQPSFDRRTPATLPRGAMKRPRAGSGSLTTSCRASCPHRPSSTATGLCCRWTTPPTW